MTSHRFTVPSALASSSPAPAILMPFVGNRQLVPTLCPPPGEHLSAPGGFHPRPEPVLFQSFPALGLVRAFHRRLKIYNHILSYWRLSHTTNTINAKKMTVNVPVATLRLLRLSRCSKHVREKTKNVTAMGRVMPKVAVANKIINKPAITCSGCFQSTCPI